MPLVAGTARKTIAHNISEMQAAGHPHDQAVAAALRTAYGKKRARGGPAVANGEKVHVGAIKAPVAGRTDHLNMKVPGGAYVVPADIVSAIGEGNTETGFAILDALSAKYSGQQMADTPPVPIVAAGGEYVIDPGVVAALGGGDLDHGHEILDAWIKAERANTIDTLKKLPGPAR